MAGAVTASIMLPAAWAHLAEKIVIIAGVWLLIDIVIVAVVFVLPVPWSGRNTKAD
jgi:hypothetical protein